MIIKPIYDVEGHHPLGYIAKGHVARDAFESSIREQWDDRFRLNRSESKLTVEHTVKRCVPTPHWPCGFVYLDSERGRGAFECTIAWVE